MRRAALLLAGLAATLAVAQEPETQPQGQSLEDMMQEEMNPTEEPSEETPSNAANNAVAGAPEGVSEARSVVPTKQAVERAQKATAQLRALDKIKARTIEVLAPANQPVRFGSLKITARYCRKRPPEETPETYAFLEIDDLKNPNKPERVFTGWMLASSPAVHALQHPVFDVWVVGCKAPSAATPGPQSPAAPKKP